MINLGENSNLELKGLKGQVFGKGLKMDELWFLDQYIKFESGGLTLQYRMTYAEQEIEIKDQIAQTCKEVDYGISPICREIYNHQGRSRRNDVRNRVVKIYGRFICSHLCSF